MFLIRIRIRVRVRGTRHVSERASTEHDVDGVRVRVRMLRALKLNPS